MSDTMTYFAELDDNNVVVHVSVVTQQFMSENPDRYPGVWVETFRDTAGKTYAGVGYIYDWEKQNFTPPPVKEFDE
jgi:hypothetical protein